MTPLKVHTASTSSAHHSRPRRSALRGLERVFVPYIALMGTVSLAPATAWSAGTCATYNSGTQVGTLSDEALDETSGLASSHLNSGIFWTHNDSGNASEIFAIRLDGTIEATLDVSSASNIDWEDMAIGPCPESCACLFIADMGDNLLVRGVKTIYRVAEPALDEGLTDTASATAMTFSYPDGLHDAETLLVDPRSGIIYVVTKEDDGTSGVYRFPSADPDSYPVTLERVAEITVGSGSTSKLATGGSVAADGGRFVIRTLNQAQEYTIPEGAELEAAFSSSPKIIPLPSSSQGEAISYTPDGMSLITVSENVPSPVYEVSCTSGIPVTEPAMGLDTYCSGSAGCGAVGRLEGATSRALGGMATGGLSLAAIVSMIRRRSRR